MQETIAYVRISDARKQDAASQEHALTTYAKDNGLVISRWVTEAVSASKTQIADRELSQYVNTGARILMTDATRLGRKGVMRLMGVIGQATENGGELHFTNTGRVITETNMDNAEIIFTVVGGSFAAVAEAESRSKRAINGHAKRKASGLTSGRRIGAIVTSKLDDHAPLIKAGLRDKTQKAQVIRNLAARGIKVSRQGLDNWIKKKVPEAEQLKSVANVTSL